jgi:hypothetical protein
MAPWLLIIPSTIIGILLFEIFSELFLPGIRTANLQPPVIYFFDGRGTVFRDYGDIFTYAPDTNIRIVTVAYSDDSFNTEYDYHIHTDNFGLVQDNDLIPDKPSLLLLGDSFTEGVGAEPWFRLVSPEIYKLGYQPVNGGLGGTGFGSWLKLEQYLAAADIRIRKVVVLFISDDYHRPASNVTLGELRCLSTLSLCRVNENVYFRYRLPPAGELSSWVAKIRMARTATREARAQALLPATYLVYKYVNERLRLSRGARASMAREERGEQQSCAAVAEFIKLFGPENVAFIHLPEKSELDSGPNQLGLKARRSIQEAGGKLFDGFKLCRLTAADYHPNDQHPNSRGYAKIAACAMNVIKQMATQ